MLFDACDHDKSGSISLAELAKSEEEWGKQSCSMKAVFERMFYADVETKTLKQDMNMDGSISFEEFVVEELIIRHIQNKYEDLRGRGLNHDELKKGYEVFKTIDVDNSGSISKKELQHAMEGMVEKKIKILNSKP